MSTHHLLKDAGTGHKFGLMDLCIKDSGYLTKLMEMDDSFMPTETSMRESGEMTRLTVKEFTSTQMEPSITVTGKKTNKMEKELRLGQMVQDTQETM